VLKNWIELRPTWNQVAGIEISKVIKKNQVCGDVDGFFTKTVNPIGVQSADCVPILLARADGGMVAALHAGWRGTKAKIVEKLAKTLVAQGENLRDWVAAVGPAIGKCCYEVGEDLIEDFSKTFPDIEPDLLSPRHRRLDLSAVNQYELHRMGFGKVDWIDECTYCSMDPSRGAIFHSFRREGGGTRQWSIIGRKPSV
jgi:YfiH family protein